MMNNKGSADLGDFLLFAFLLLFFTSSCGGKMGINWVYNGEVHNIRLMDEKEVIRETTMEYK